MAINRRQFATGAGAVALSLTAPEAWGQDVQPPQPAQPAWELEAAKILNGAKPIAGKIVFEIPEIAENGNTVPFTLSMESPMTEANHVKAMHLLATGNPQPGVAAFKFTPSSGKAAVSSRMRLGRTQDVVVIAELSDGRFVQAKRNVKVTIGGCGG